MANRLILGAQAGTFILRTTVPGAEVTNEALDDRLVTFDSRWPDMGKVYMQGQFTGASMQDYSNGGTPSAVGRVPMGYTPSYLNLPMVLGMVLWNYGTMTQQNWFGPMEATSTYVEGSNMVFAFEFTTKAAIQVVYYTIWRPFDD